MNEDTEKYKGFSSEERKVLKDLLQDEEILKELIETRRAWNAMGKFAGSMKTFFTWMLFMAATYVSFKAGLIEWIRAGMKS